MMPTSTLRSSFLLHAVTPLLAACWASLAAPLAAQERAAAQDPQANPYKLEPFEPGFPVKLDYPRMVGLEYSRTRRQALQRLASNLQGNTSRETWQLATEFFWRAPEDAGDPLIEAMDRAMSNPALGDVVRNCVEAMGKARNDEFDAALRRAVQHKSDGVRQAAYVALASSGSQQTLRRLAGDFTIMTGRGREAWLRGVRLRLPEQRVQLLRQMMVADFPTRVRDQVLKEAAQLPVKEAAEVLRPRWGTAVDQFKAIVAGVLHANGEAAGTAYLRDAMLSENLDEVTWAVRHCAFGPDPDAAIGDLREVLLRLSTHLRPEIRLEVAKQLTRIDGDDVADVFEVMTAPDEIWEIRALATRELTRRGRGQLVSVLLEELPTATGTRLQAIINQLSASGDPRAVPVLVERFEKAPEGQGRPFVQAIAQNGSDAAAEALFDLFAGPEKLVTRSDDNPLTTRSYLPTLFLNLRGSEHVIVDRFLKLPKEQWELRARVMGTITGYAADRRQDQELVEKCVEPVRKVLFDQSELPQLRVLALNLLTRNWLTIDDAMRLKRMIRKEQPGLRGLFADFLNNAF
ncbi:MAG: HEAT repeat domain-containing protein [Planctomycetota bacterium]